LDNILFFSVQHVSALNTGHHQARIKICKERILAQSTLLLLLNVPQIDVSPKHSFDNDKNHLGRYQKT
jgi:hypothetical protein